MCQIKISSLLGVIACAAFAPSAFAATLFSEDFSTAPGQPVALNGLVPTVGNAFNVSVDNAPGSLQVNGGVVNTSGGRRVFDVPFASALGAGQTLDVSIALNPLGNFFSGGFAGFRLVTGGVGGTSFGFFGDSNDDTTGFDLAPSSDGGLGEVKSGVNTLPSTALLTYAYDTGATTLSVNGTQVATTTFTSGQAVNDIQFENNGGGDASISSISATSIPEPSSLMAIFGGVAVLVARRRRS